MEVHPFKIKVKQSIVVKALIASISSDIEKSTE